MDNEICFNLHTHSDQFNAFIQRPLSQYYAASYIIFNGQRFAKFTLK